MPFTAKDAIDTVSVPTQPGSPIFEGHEPDSVQRGLRANGTKPLIPGHRRGERAIRHDETHHRERRRIEVAICRPKDFRQLGRRHDELATDCAPAVALAAVAAPWCRRRRSLSVEFRTSRYACAEPPSANNSLPVT